jgi:hypothetical protein
LCSSLLLWSMFWEWDPASKSIDSPVTSWCPRWDPLLSMMKGQYQLCLTRDSLHSYGFCLVGEPPCCRVAKCRTLWLPSPSVSMKVSPQSRGGISQATKASSRIQSIPPQSTMCWACPGVYTGLPIAMESPWIPGFFSHSPFCTMTQWPFCLWQNWRPSSGTYGRT